MIILLLVILIIAVLFPNLLRMMIYLFIFSVVWISVQVHNDCTGPDRATKCSGVQRSLR